MQGTGGYIGASRSQQGRGHLSLPISAQEGPAPVPDGLPGRGFQACCGGPCLPCGASCHRPGCPPSSSAGSWGKCASSSGTLGEAGAGVLNLG